MSRGAIAGLRAEPLPSRRASSRAVLLAAILCAAVAGPAAIAAPADSIGVAWRAGAREERRTIPAGAHELQAMVRGVTRASVTVLPESAARGYIVRFGAPPAAASRGRLVDLESVRSPYRRFLADLAGLESAARAGRANGGPVRVRRRLEVAYNGVAITASEALAGRVRALPYVTGVFPDDSVHALADPSHVQTGVDRLRAERGLSGAGVLVSIVDTGVDWAHAALGGCIGPSCRVAGGYDFVNDDTNPMDDHGHGTHVAGIVGAAGAGLEGVAPAVRFLAYKVLAASGGGLVSDVIAGIDRSLDPDGNPLTDDAADVINLSVGAQGNAGDPLSQAVDQAVAAGVVCVAAAGNAGADFTISSPGCARDAITVGAVTSTDALAAFSSRGPSAPDDAIKPDLLAPGVGILSAWPGGGSRALSGTSMATPHVAGVAALLLEAHPQWTPAMVKSALMNSAVDLGLDPFRQGAGRIDAHSAGAAAVTILPATLSFGLAPTAAPSWATSVTLTLRNLGAAAEEVSLSTVSGLPSGSSFRVSPATVTLAAAETREVVATLALDHAPVVAAAPFAYAGELRAAAGGRTWRVPFAVLRTPQLRVRVDQAGMVVVHDRAGHEVSLFANGPGTTRLFLPNGTYDVMAAFGADRRVVREGIVLADSQGVDLGAADAVHALERVCVDERGLAVTMPAGVEYLRHRATGAGFLSFGGMPSTMRSSSMSAEYDWEWHRLSYGQEPTLYDFKGVQRGVSGSVVSSNTAADLRRVTLTHHPGPEVRQLLPVRWVSDGPLGSMTENGPAVSSIAITGPLPPLEPPFTQQAYFMSTPGEGFHLASRVHEGYPYRGVPYPSGAAEVRSPYLIADPGQPLRGHLRGDAARPVFTLAGDRVDVGLGPPVWFGAFRNRADALVVSPLAGDAGWIFLTQQGGWRDHAALPFELRREDTIVETGVMTGGLGRPLVAGTHTLTLTNGRYSIDGTPGRATVVATFDSRAADPDPPSLSELRVLVDGASSDRAPAGSPCVVRFGVEDAQALGAVTLSARATSAEPWAALPLAHTDGLFEAALPTSRGDALALRIEAEDAAGNLLAYTLEPALVIHGGGDATPPVVSVLAPDGGESWVAGSRRDIRWDAGDDVAVDSVTIQVSYGGGDYRTVAAGLANSGAWTWTVPGATAAAARVRVLARDAAGNVGSDSSAAPFAIVPDPNLAPNGGFESGIAEWTRNGSATLTHAAEGRTGARSLQIRGSSSSSFGCDDDPNAIAAVVAKGAVYRFSAWVKSPAGSRGSVRLRLYEYLGTSQQGSTASSGSVTLSSTWKPLTLDYTVRTAGSTLSLRVIDSPSSSGETFLVDDVSITLVSAPPDRPPVVAAPAQVAGYAGRPITFAVTATDPDGQPIVSLSASGQPPLATFLAPTPAAATFAWTPGEADVSPTPYLVTFTASNAASAQAITRITVATAPPNLCGNGGFDTGTTGWGKYENGVLARVPGGRSGHALQVTGSSTFGVDDTPDWLPAPLVKGDVYRISCHVKGVGGAKGSIRIRVYEFVGSSQQGSTVYSQVPKLTPDWQPLTATHTVRTSGSRISIRVTDSASSTESFLLDDVTIERLGAGALAASAGDDPGEAAERETEPLVFAASFSPNPVRGEGVLAFSTTRTGSAEVDLFDVNGRLVRRLLPAGALAAGHHRLRVGRGLAAGLYFYRIRSDEGVLGGRLVLLQ